MSSGRGGRGTARGGRGANKSNRGFGPRGNLNGASTNGSNGNVTTSAFAAREQRGDRGQRGNTPIGGTSAEEDIQSSGIKMHGVGGKMYESPVLKITRIQQRHKADIAL
jgi:hypothetical protein